MDRVNILVVEDERVVALDIKGILESRGYIVPAIASSGKEAIQLASEEHPDLILMDIRLKGEMDGVQAAEEIRTRLDIPVIYLTAYADEATLQRAKITEPFGYLLKPFEERELCSTIEMACYKHQMERKLRQMYEAEQHARQTAETLSRRLVEVQEDERRTIARELHDEAGQSLTSLIVGLRLLEEHSCHDKVVAGQVAELKRTVHNVLESLHRLATDLRPASLDHLGLVEALRQYVQAFSRQHHLIVQFEAVGLGDERLSPNEEIALFRVAQEALTNVVRHSQATYADVLLERRGDRLILMIEDDGTGFDPAAAMRAGRLGLAGMRERAEMLGGSLVIESSAGAGTTILVEVPYAHSHPHCG
jgi:signal transduction histidine kinase